MNTATAEDTRHSTTLDPLVILLIPVLATNPLTQATEIGLLTYRIASGSQKGLLATPAGHLDDSNLSVPDLGKVLKDPKALFPENTKAQLLSVETLSNGDGQLILAQLPVIEESALHSFTPNQRISKLVILFSPEKLATPTFTYAVKRFFEERMRNQSGALTEAAFS